MHHCQRVVGGVEGFRVDLVLARDLAVLALVGEALLLDPGDVQHVQRGQNRRQFGVLLDRGPLLVEVVADVAGELEALGADEVLLGVEVRQRVRKRVDGPAVLQVAHDPDPEVVQARVLADRVQVEQGLGWVLAGTVAAVDQRHVDELGGHLGRPLAGVAQHQRVRVPLDNADGVGETLPLLHARGVDRPHVDDVAAQTFDRRREAHLRPRARLEKEQAEQRPLVAVRVGRRIGRDLTRVVEDRLDVLP